MDKQNKNGGYALKGVKSFEGREGYGYNAVLYKDGRKIATVLDEGNGGTTLIRWNDGNRSKDVADFDAFLATLPPDTSMPGHSLSVDADLFLGRLVDAYGTLASLRRKVKKLVVFVEGGKLYTCKPRPGTALDAAVKAVGVKYPAATILNTRNENEWLGLVAAA